MSCYQLLGVSVTIAFSSISCAVTFCTSSPIVSAAPFAFHGVHFAGEPRKKWKEEESGAVLISIKEMWARFQKCQSEISSSSRQSRLPKDRSVPSLPFRLAPHRLPRPHPLILVFLKCLLLLTQPTRLLCLDSAVCLAHLVRLPTPHLACIVWPGDHHLCCADWPSPHHPGHLSRLSSPRMAHQSRSPHSSHLPACASHPYCFPPHSDCSCDSSLAASPASLLKDSSADVSFLILALFLEPSFQGSFISITMPSHLYVRLCS